MVIRPNINKTHSKEYKKTSQFQSGIKVPKKTNTLLKINMRGIAAFTLVLFTSSLIFKRYMKGEVKNSDSVVEEKGFHNSIKESQLMFKSVSK